MITRERIVQKIMDSEIIRAALQAETLQDLESIESRYRKGEFGPVDNEFALVQYVDINADEDDPDAVFDEGVELITLDGKDIVTDPFSSHVVLSKIFDQPSAPYRVELMLHPFEWHANGESESILCVDFKNLDEALDLMVTMQNAENHHVREYQWDDQTQTLNTSPSSYRLENEDRWAREHEEKMRELTKYEQRFDYDECTGI